MNKIVKIGGIAAIAVVLVAGGLVTGLAVSGGLSPNKNSAQTVPYAYGTGKTGGQGGQFGYGLERGYDGTPGSQGDPFGYGPNRGRGFGGAMGDYGPGGMMGDYGPGMMGDPFGYGRNRGRGFGGMMGGWGGSGGMMGGWGGSDGMMGGFVPDASTVPAGETLTLDEAVELAEAYIDAFDGVDLELAEVMQFSNHFYAQAREGSTGVNAFEFLIDPFTGAVHPEPGPNMMWNVKYGHMGRGMMDSWDYDYSGETTTAMVVTPEEATELAQEYLDAALPGATADEDANAFYGYYTLHILGDGEVVGMLSVNGSTGQVWPHMWHGEFVDMVGHDHE